LYLEVVTQWVNLPGVVHPPFDQERYHGVDIGIGLDDHGRHF